MPANTYEELHAQVEPDEAPRQCQRKKSHNMKRFSGGKDFIMPNLKFAKYIGYAETFYLGLLISQLDYCEENKPSDIIDGYFPITEQFIADKLGISPRTQRRIKAKLKALGFIKIKTGSSKYLLKQNWIMINMEIVSAFNKFDHEMIVGVLEDKGYQCRAKVAPRKGQSGPTERPERPHIYNTSNNTHGDSSSPKEHKGGGASAPLDNSPSKATDNPATGNISTDDEWVRELQEAHAQLNGEPPPAKVDDNPEYDLLAGINAMMAEKTDEHSQSHARNMPQDS